MYIDGIQFLYGYYHIKLRGSNWPFNYASHNFEPLTNTWDYYQHLIGLIQHDHEEDLLTNV